MPEARPALRPTVASTDEVPLVVAMLAAPEIRPPPPANVLARLVSLPFACTDRLPIIFGVADAVPAVVPPMLLPMVAAVRVSELALASAAPRASPPTVIPVASAFWRVVLLATTLKSPRLPMTTLSPTFANVVLLSPAVALAAFAAK